MIESLEKRGYYNIYIIDNASSFPPLLDYYKNCKYKVFRLKKNVGYRALWRTYIRYRFMFTPFVYTDSDVVLIEECPDDFMSYFYNILKKYPDVFKVGFSLKIDDLPDHYKNKQDVIEWEQKFYQIEKEKNLFIAPVDTTFALYRPFSKKGKCDGSVEMLRTGYPYQAHHMPWYVDSNNLSQEEAFYIKSTSRSTHWTEQSKSDDARS